MPSRSWQRGCVSAHGSTRAGDEPMSLQNAEIHLYIIPKNHLLAFVSQITDFLIKMQRFREFAAKGSFRFYDLNKEMIKQKQRIKIRVINGNSELKIK